MISRIYDSVFIGLLAFIFVAIMAMVARLLGDFFVPAVLVGLVVGVFVFVADLLTSTE